VIPFAVLLPLSVFAFGLVNKFVDGNVGLVLSLFCLFFNGGGVSGQALHIRYYRRLINELYIKVNMTYAACAAYLVDVMQSQSSEILAAMKFVVSFH
jgi:hypothetical protein